MFTPPLFEDNILSTLWRNFSFYFNDGYWGYFFLTIMGLVFLQFLWIKLRPAFLTFPNKIYRFNLHIDYLPLIFFILAFVCLCLITYAQEMSLFANFDLMSIGTTVTFAEGKGTGISDIRFSPFANVELNLFYAISHNLYVVSFLVLTETALLLYLLYLLFDFVPVSRRLCALALVGIYPALVWINNPIFPERLMLIFICLSLLMLKKYLTCPKTRYLMGFCLLMNLAIYTKETVILFYAGLLGCELLYLIYRGQITPTSFLHPFKTAKTLPLEYMMFFSMGLFAFIYLLFGLGINSNQYVSAHINSEAWKKYYLEFFICFCAVISLIFSKKFSVLLFGFGAGAWMILLFVAWKLGIYNENNAPYYAIVSGIFGLFLVFYTLEKKLLLSLFGLAFLVMAILQNYSLFKKQSGESYYDAAKFISSLASKQNPLPIFVKDSLEGKYESYIIDCYRSAYKFYFPHKNIVFKTNSDADLLGNVLKFPLIYQATPKTGDIYVLNKIYNEDSDRYELLYENANFKIFRVR